MIVVPNDCKILVYGPKLANVVSSPVGDDEYEQLPALFGYMCRVMRLWGGCGLSAPQIGVFRRVAIVQRGPGVMALVNPTIERMYGRELEGVEGCLSVPPAGNQAKVCRMEHVTVEYRTATAPFQSRCSILSGQESVIAQHEIDHLDGTFFFDRSPSRERVLRDFNRWNQERKQNAKSTPR